MKLEDCIANSIDCDFYMCEGGRHYLITQDDFERLNVFDDLEIALIKPVLNAQSNLNQTEFHFKARCSVYLKRKEEMSNDIKC